MPERKRAPSIAFDRSASAVYIRVRRGKAAESEVVREGIIMDFDSDRKLIGIELLLPGSLKEHVAGELDKFSGGKS